MSSEVAIIAMSCRFPGADDLDAFWRNIVEGRESITHFSDEELRRNGVGDGALKDRSYVRSGFTIPDIELFDAEFFGFTPREAQLLDPQQRLFLECVWHALEQAGHIPETYAGRIGVYAGAFTSVYLLNLYSQPGLVDAVGELAVRHANEKDYLATRTSYKLNLKGPSLSLQTSCSTSLVAVHTAVQSLLAGECDLAVSGAVSLGERGKGYLHQAGGLLSADGHCRPFDAAAGGTVFGSGVGVVVLKRLEDARSDGNTIYGVIKGSAINNDGADKVGFTAPSVNGQAEVILEALAMAETPAETVGLVEAHGTGTPLGDPIEIEALTRAWRTQTPKAGYCAIGSVKANVGHLGTAAGMAGLIKAALALHHKTLPPTINFTSPNPDIDFASSPFFVNTEAQAWPEAAHGPRRAAVSSFGMGGTNAHLVLEEAPVTAPQAARADQLADQLLVLSARSEPALREAAARLGRHLEAHPDVSLRDVATTLLLGRKAFSWRASLVASSVAQASELLAGPAAGRLSPRQALQAPSVAFVFPGQGSQYSGACRGLYSSQPELRRQLELCCEILDRHGGPELRSVMSSGTEALTRTELVQPLLFAQEYALARMLMAMGITPAAMLGHSIGEYVAATLAGVLGLEDALKLVALRGRLMQGTAEGKMLSVPLSEAELAAHLHAHPGLSIAAINGPAQCVASGPEAELARLQEQLAGAGVATRRLATSHAFHSPTMEPILEGFLRAVEKVRLQAPAIPYLSNVTGTWITAEQATDPRYWCAHLREPVRFDQGVRALMEAPERILVEVGPGTTLTGLLRAHPAVANSDRVVALSRHPKDQASDAATLAKALGELWASGLKVSAPAPAGKRIPLPGYPFERKRYWIDRIFAPAASAAVQWGHLDASSSSTAAAATSAVARGERPAPNGHEAASARRPRDVEAAVRGIWQTLFGAPSQSDDEDFFASGGTSLVAMQMIAQVREIFSVELSIESLFDDPTVRGIAAQIKPLLDHGEAPEAAAGGDSPELAEMRALLQLSGGELSDEQLVQALLDAEAAGDPSLADLQERTLEMSGDSSATS